MKHILTTVFLLISCGLPLVHAESTGKQIVKDLLQAGVQAVQKKAEEKQVQNGGEEALPMGGMSAKSMLVNQALNGVLNQYKGELKDTARVAGDALAERLLADERVQQALLALKALAWALTGYLTLVTLSMLGALANLKRSCNRILSALATRR